MRRHEAKAKFWRSFSLSLVASFLSACATAPTLALDGDSNGVVVGSLSTDGKAEPLKHVYARRLPQKDDGTIPIRVILSPEMLTRQVLDQISRDAWAGGEAKGFVIDIGADSKWSARFMTSWGLQDTFGFTSSGGEAKVDEGRARGRIALSNQGDAGIRAFRVSFDIPVEISDVETNSAVKELAGHWRIDTWTATNGDKYDGDLEIFRRGRGMIGTAMIRSDKYGVVTESFDVSVEGNFLRLYGVVDPDAHWIADTFTLEAQPDKLTGLWVDGTGNSGPVSFSRSY
jgi:hypothetical protein